MCLLDPTPECPAANEPLLPLDLTPSVDVRRLGVHGYSLCVSSRSNWIDKPFECITHAGKVQATHGRLAACHRQATSLWPSFWYQPAVVSSPLLLRWTFSPRWWMICCLVGRAHSSSAERFPAMGLVPSVCSFASLRCYILRIPSSQTHCLVSTLCADACRIKEMK